jgi:hypothetical protein
LAQVSKSDLNFSLLNEAGIVVWNSSNYRIHSGINAFQFSAKEMIRESKNGIFFLKTKYEGKDVLKKIIVLQ